MEYLGNTEQTSPTPVIEIGKKYWVRSRTTGKAILVECTPSPFSTKYGCFDFDRLPFERFDVFGPAVDTVEPNFDALKAAHG